MSDDFDALMAEFMADRDAAQSENETAKDPAQAAAERKATLEAMAARGGTAGQFAAELLAIAEERRQKAERDAQVAELEAAAADGDVNLDDPVVQEQLRAAVLAKREQDDASFLRLYAQSQEAKGFPAESAQEMARQAAAGLTPDSWFWAKSDPLGESETYMAHRAQQAAEARARLHAQEKLSSMAESAAEAQAGITETLQRVAGAS